MRSSVDRYDRFDSVDAMLILRPLQTLSQLSLAFKILCFAHPALSALLPTRLTWSSNHGVHPAINCCCLWKQVSACNRLKQLVSSGTKIGRHTSPEMMLFLAHANSFQVQASIAAFLQLPQAKYSSLRHPTSWVFSNIHKLLTNTSTIEYICTDYWIGLEWHSMVAFPFYCWYIHFLLRWLRDIKVFP